VKLLFVLPEYPPDFGGGIATHYAALLSRLAARGHTVDVIVGSAMVSDRPAYKRGGVSVQVLESERFRARIPRFARYAAMPALQRSLAAAWGMYDQVRGGDGYDAVEVVDWGLTFAPWLARPTGPPVRVQLHGSSGQIAAYDALAGQRGEAHVLRLIEAALLRTAPLLATSSRANQRHWESVTGRDVLYGPPPVEAAAPLAAEPGGRGFVAARLQEWKGPETLCAALDQLGADAPPVEWAGRSVPHPASGEPYEKHLAATYPGVWGRSLLPLGPLPPAEVARRQRGAAFVVVPSLWDVFNLSIAEAMLQEAVVISSDGAGGVDLIEHGRTGFIFPAGDAAALAEIMREVVALPEERQRGIGRAARQTASDRLDPEAVADRWLDDLRSAPDRPAGADAWVAAAASPGPEVDALAFCDHLPAGNLGRYLVTRGLRTIRDRLRRLRPES
jgi:glycosyltransferase involved in cell wall biosynthesis